MGALASAFDLELTSRNPRVRGYIWFKGGHLNKKPLAVYKKP